MYPRISNASSSPSNNFQDEQKEALDSMNRILILLLTAGMIAMSACASGAQVSPQGSAKPSASPSVQASAPQVASPPAASSAAPVPVAKPLLANRVDVIYFHMNQRCVTCLCFEEHVNQVMQNNFADAISSGKLTYRVLNAQDKQNIDIAKKYQVVGSQLFINSVLNGDDHIKDLQEIWDWDCRNNAQEFEAKVRNAIELRLKALG
jgi:hypothetical protein